MNHTFRTVALMYWLTAAFWLFSHHVPKLIETQYLLAGVAAVLTRELLLAPMSFLVLKEAIAVVEDSRTVAALHFCGFVSVQVA